MIRMEHVSKVYENGAVGLNDVSVHIEQGEFVFVVGPSGSGKSTFIRLLMREIEADKGLITINDVDITALKHKEIPYLRRKVGVVFQDFRLLPSKTVYDNVAFAMQVVETPQRIIKRNVPQILAMVGLNKKAWAYPHQLSGGEQQRVALARAIINKPPILLADEPTGNLDPVTAREIMDLLQEINERGTTIVVATHAKDIVDEMQKRVITISKGKIKRDEEGGYGNEASELEILF